MPLYIGLMSGTSMDGIDAALVELEGGNASVLDTHCAPLSPSLKTRLEAFCNQSMVSIEQLGEIDVELGRLFAQSAIKLMERNQLSPTAITAIGSHGQTIFHAPNGSHPFTLQIGDANTIAELTGITTVADFRRRDMAAGGQGAPLVPAFHEAVFYSPQKNRAIVNIGGIANITTLPKDSTRTTTGFDTGPGNALLDAWCQQHLKQPFDNDGHWARGGSLQETLLNRLRADPYFDLPPPKSSGKEHFNLHWLRERVIDESPQDVQRSLIALTAITIARALEKYAPDTEEIFVCGGGAKNSLLMEELRAQRPNQPVSTTQELGIHPDWVEAVAFAWLARQCLNSQPANLPAVTGARHRVILGGIYPANPA